MESQPLSVSQQKTCVSYENMLRFLLQNANLRSLTCYPTGVRGVYQFK